MRDGRIETLAFSVHGVDGVVVGPVVAVYDRVAEMVSVLVPLCCRDSRLGWEVVRVRIFIGGEREGYGMHLAFDPCSLNGER